MSPSTSTTWAAERGWPSPTTSHARSTIGLVFLASSTKDQRSQDSSSLFRSTNDVDLVKVRLCHGSVASMVERVAHGLMLARQERGDQ
jgi:hypothetical protein